MIMVGASNSELKNWRTQMTDAKEMYVITRPNKNPESGVDGASDLLNTSIRNINTLGVPPLPELHLCPP